jgi:hypothetical protein
MVLTVVLSIFFYVITSVVGNWLCHRVFRSADAGLLLEFIIGFAMVTAVCNIVSFFAPVNYFIPLLLLIFVILLHKNFSRTLKRWIAVARSWKRTDYLTALPVFALLIFYALLPPQHGDSAGYHFATARWIENYKVIPGLANVHGRFGFNSSFFTTTAAFSFSEFFGQAIYTINIVFTFMFYGWLLNRIVHVKGSYLQWCYLFVAIAMFRILLVCTSSPTPDAVAAILVVYVFITVAEDALRMHSLFKEKSIALICVIAFGLIVKLTTAPLVVVALYLFLSKKLYSYRTYLFAIAIGVLLTIAPWLLRNYIISGYLVYPAEFTGFFKPEWQVPVDVLRFDKLLINNGPKMIDTDWYTLDHMSFFEWFPLWLKANFQYGFTASVILFLLSFAGGIVAAVYSLRIKQFNLFFVLSSCMLGLIYWVTNSPDYRFGLAYIVSLIFIAASIIARKNYARKFDKNVPVLFLLCSCAYYSIRSIKVLKHYPLQSYLVKPLRSPDYSWKNDLSTFKFIQMGNNVKLYIDDKDHTCNNAPLPCYITHYEKLLPAKVKLRGKSIEDGFKVDK